MKFTEFKTNVERWQADHGIYVHSTALAQALKAVSEVGELADAVIKGDREALKDAIGDTMVRLVGVAKMIGRDIAPAVESESWSTVDDSDTQQAAALAAARVSDVCASLVIYRPAGRIKESILDSAFYLNAIAIKNDLTLMECCEAAWLEIKDRKGRMVEGGAFVKEGDV